MNDDIGARAGRSRRRPAVPSRRCTPPRWRRPRRRVRVGSSAPQLLGVGTGAHDGDVVPPAPPAGHCDARVRLVGRDHVVGLAVRPALEPQQCLRERRRAAPRSATTTTPDTGRAGRRRTGIRSTRGRRARRSRRCRAGCTSGSRRSGRSMNARAVSQKVMSQRPRVLDGVADRAGSGRCGPVLVQRHAVEHRVRRVAGRLRADDVHVVARVASAPGTRATRAGRTGRAGSAR